MGAAILSAGAFASGTVSSEVKNNVAYVYHKDAYWNCCPDTLFEIIPNPDSAFIIDIYEHDRGTHPCKCECYFDFTHTLEGLAPGTYTARVWEAFFDLEPVVAGTTVFVIPSRTGLLDLSSSMSNCHEEPGVNESDPLPLAASLETSSPVTARSVGIAYTLERATGFSISIYNSAGIKVRSLERGVQSSGTHAARWNACDDSGNKVPRGTYFVLLETRYGVQSLPLIVLR